MKKDQKKDIKSGTDPKIEQQKKKEKGFRRQKERKVTQYTAKGDGKAAVRAKETKEKGGTKARRRRRWEGGGQGRPWAERVEKQGRKSKRRSKEVLGGGGWANPRG